MSSDRNDNMSSDSNDNMLNDSSDKKSSDKLSNDSSKEETNKDVKEKIHNSKKKSLKLNFDLSLNDITYLEDGIVQNKKKPNDEKFEFDINIPYEFIFRLSKYIK